MPLWTLAQAWCSDLSLANFFLAKSNVWVHCAIYFIFHPLCGCHLILRQCACTNGERFCQIEHRTSNIRMPSHTYNRYKGMCVPQEYFLSCSIQFISYLPWPNFWKVDRGVRGVMVSMQAFQACVPGSIPGGRMSFWPGMPVVFLTLPILVIGAANGIPFLSHACEICNEKIVREHNGTCDGARHMCVMAIVSLGKWHSPFLKVKPGCAHLLLGWATP